MAQRIPTPLFTWLDDKYQIEYLQPLLRYPIYNTMSNTMYQSQRPRPKHTQLPRLYTRFSTAPQPQYTIAAYPPIPARQRQSQPPPPRELPTPLRIARPVSYRSYTTAPRTRQPETGAQALPRSKYIPAELPTGEYVPFGAKKPVKSGVDEISTMVQASIEGISREQSDDIEIVHASPGGDYLATPLCAPDAFRALTPPTPSISTSIQSTPIQRPLSAPPTPSSASLFSQVRKSLTFSDDLWADIDEEMESEEYTDEFNDVLEEYHDQRLGRIRIGTIRR